jgi:hypothetical protein
MDMDHMNGICKSCDELFTIFHKHALAYEEEQKIIREEQGDKFVQPPLGYFNLYSALADMALEMVFLGKFLGDLLEEAEKKEK